MGTRIYERTNSFKRSRKTDTHRAFIISQALCWTLLLKLLHVTLLSIYEVGIIFHKRENNIRQVIEMAQWLIVGE